jgi:hypothetical protein
MVIRKRPGFRNVLARRVVPAEIRFLDRIFGFGHRAKHAIRESEQTRTMRLETRCGIVRHPRCVETTALSNAIVAPPTTMRVQALPWPMAYLTVG